jgi:hypothetical protein
MQPRSLSLVGIVLLLILPASSGAAAPLEFERIVIDGNFPGGYQVEVADVNGDKKPDIIALGGSTIAWYENPSWTKRVIATGSTTHDIISSATADLDGDGRAEVAIAYDFSMNEPKRGKLLLAIQGKTSGDPWTFKQVADVPSIHRVRWGDVDGDGRLDLVVAPIFGPGATPPKFDQDPARLSVFTTGNDPKAERWTSQVVARRPVMHSIEVIKIPVDSRSVSIFTADNDGVGLVRGGVVTRLIPGGPGNAPNRGSSEVHNGKLADGRTFLATIDPWHGSEVAVCLADPNRSEGYAPRTVIDATLDVGHALWVADVDGDGNDEVFAGHRGKNARVAAYRFDGKTWTRTILDPTLTAQDLRGGDLDGDGRPDVVAIGGQSHNVVWFKPIRTRTP